MWTQPTGQLWVLRLAWRPGAGLTDGHEGLGGGGWAWTCPQALTA